MGRDSPADRPSIRWIEAGAAAEGVEEDEEEEMDESAMPVAQERMNSRSLLESDRWDVSSRNGV